MPSDMMDTVYISISTEVGLVDGSVDSSVEQLSVEPRLGPLLFGPVCWMTEFLDIRNQKAYRHRLPALMSDAWISFRRL